MRRLLLLMLIPAAVYSQSFPVRVRLEVDTIKTLTQPSILNILDSLRVVGTLTATGAAQATNVTATDTLVSGLATANAGVVKLLDGASGFNVLKATNAVTGKVWSLPGITGEIAMMSTSNSGDFGISGSGTFNSVLTDSISSTANLDVDADTVNLGTAVLSLSYVPLTLKHTFNATRLYEITGNTEIINIYSGANAYSTAAPFTNAAIGIVGRGLITSDNTQDWTKTAFGLVGTEGAVRTTAGATGTVTSSVSLLARSEFFANMTVTNHKGLFVQGLSGTGTMPTNVYGIYVEDMDDGTSTNYAIYTEAGDVRFGDDLAVVNTIDGGSGTSGQSTIQSSGLSPLSVYRRITNANAGSFINYDMRYTGNVRATFATAGALGQSISAGLQSGGFGIQTYRSAVAYLGFYQDSLQRVSIQSKVAAAPFGVSNTTQLGVKATNAVANIFEGYRSASGTAVIAADTNGGVLASAYLADTSAFSGTATRAAVSVPGAKSTDVYQVTWRLATGDESTVPSEVPYYYAKTDSLIVFRNAGTTSGLKFSWERKRKQ